RDTVPFAEARSRVARNVAGSIEDPHAVLAAWLDRRTPDIEVPSAILAAAPDTLSPDATLATWPDAGRLTFADYRAWATTQPASWNMGGMGSDPDAFRAAIVEVARRHMALDEARRRDIAVPDAEHAKLERKWGDEAYQWSATFAFQSGWSPSQVAQAALGALGRSGQSTAIARDALDQRAPLLAARYDMAVDSTGP
ncbi:MAG: hypothetical protein PVJ02_19170, partial [Gemmatimonadota bacterium]